MVRFSIDSVFDVSDDDNDDDVELETNHRDDKPTNDDSDDDDDDEEEEEDAHPLGFGTSWSKHATNISSAWGRTRFCLDPPRESLREYQKRWGYDDVLPSSSSSIKLLSPQQTFPSLSNYLDPDTAPTAALARLALHHQEQDQKEQEIARYGSMSPQHPTTPLRLTMSSSSSSTTKRPLSSSSSNTLVVVAAKSPSTPSLPPTPPLSSAYLQVADDMKKLAQVSQVRYQKIQQHMQHERHKMQQEHDQFQKALQALLRDDEAEANRVRRQYQEEQQMRMRQQQQQEEEEERARQEEEEAATAAAKIEEQAKQKQEQQQQQQQALKEATDAKTAAQQKQQQQSAATSSTPPRRTPTADTASDDTPEYVAQAQRLVSKLVLVRESVAPFETSKLVSQRRLRMKKIVNGKVNTLSESVDKIRQVAQEVSDAIHQARQEDDQMKLQMQQAKAQQQQVPPELGRGKRYLVDLLASSTIVRAQAEGFNGPRGDGFPLASMLAMVSVDQKELVPIFAAHVYTVCPTAIPTLPRMASLSHDDEEALQKSLGMAKTKTGEFETFERFLARTEGIVSLVADIMSSEPSTHVLMGGHKGAVDWLDRFLNLLPPAPAAPLPLITAPVLIGFLTRAGHMLANKHATEFTKHVDLIRNDIVKRLDEGAIGKPSATRLAKLVEGGFTYFQQTLPSKSLPELYYGARGGGGGASTMTSSSQFGRPPAAANTSTVSQSSNNNPFGTRQDTITSPFGGSSSTSNPFGSSSTATVPSPFGGGQSTSAATVPSPFGGGQSSNSSSSFMSGGIQSNQSGNTNDSMMTNDSSSNAFGGGTSFSGMSAGGTTTPFGGTSSSAFGTGAVSSSPSPFGPPATTMARPFGTQSPFGNPAPSPSPFGPPVTASSATTFGSGATTPFGGGIAPSPSPFGQTAASFQSPFGQSTPSPSPFTKPAMAPSPSPFGSPFGQGAPTPSPFGQPAPAPTPFGQAAPTPSPFGQPAPAPTPFGQAAPTPSPFGQPAPVPTPFGQAAPTPSPFGQPAPTPSPFGQPASNPSPFGQVAPSPSPFSQTTPFGVGGGGGNGPTRGSDGRELCKFFAKGKCMYGADCRFSHEQPQGGANFGSGMISSSPFGGPRR